ncbi:hypothetical protein KC953_03045 [Candidatus Saccharibacteria bacterium]|nr:hypothetical protein [Candidatus Saccharibacteria bacterium]
MPGSEGFICGMVVTQAPTLQDVMDAKKWGVVTFPVATLSATLRDDSPVWSTCTMGDMTLCNIRNILLDDNDRQFSFEGDCVFTYQQGEQTSFRAEATPYRVIVRWSGLTEHDSTAYLLQLG